MRIDEISKTDVILTEKELGVRSQNEEVQ